MKREMMNQINRIVLNVLYRGLRVLYQKDSRVRAEMGSWACLLYTSPSPRDRG